MIRITSFAKAKENASGSMVNNGYANTATHVTVNKTGVDGVNLWGQYHDHTADISGDMSGVGNITANGNVVTTGDIQGRNITATNHIQAQSIDTNTLNATGDVYIEKTLTIDGDIISDGDIRTNKIYATDINVTNDFSTLNLFATNGEITNLTSSKATIENLTVTKAAHFYQLIIDEIKATKGQFIVTPANAEVIDVTYNSANGGIYILFFLANDETTGKQISNTFAVNDQILCQTFNAATGTSYDNSNKFYWARCFAVSETPVERTINGVKKMCHFISLYWTDKDPNTNGVPEVGDEIVMLGNRTDTLRQNAITLGAYNNPFLDSTIKAPFIIQYAGINNYNLSAHRKNVISNGYNMYNGIFTTTTGDNIEDLINQIGEGALTYMHTAYSTSSDGSQDFSKSYFNGAAYMGFCSNHTQSDTALIYSDYTWVRIKGENGESGELSEYKLVPITEQAPIDKDGTVGLFLQYNILHISGETYETVNATSTLCAFFKAHYETGTNINAYTDLTIDTKTPTYTDASFQTDYNDPRTKKLLYVEIILANSNPDLSPQGNIIYDRRLLYPSMLPSTTFEITDEIKSTVQGHEDLIDGMTNSISTIQQQYNQIQSTVASHTTQINDLGDDIDALDGRVTTNTTNISQITQRADRIEATVTNHTTSINQNTTDIANLKLTADEIMTSVDSFNASTQNLFNFTYCKWSNAVPFIQGYGIEATANVARISNLGFDGEGGDFVVTCQMRMQYTTTNINVNLCDTAAEDNASTQEVTQNWKTYTFKFKNVQQYIGGTSETTTSYNGFIDFEGATNSNRLIVRRLMINRGNVAIAWGVSAKDAESNKDEENIVTEWTLTSMEEQEETYKGYKSYKATETPTSGNYINYMFRTELDLEANTPYTLSFYANNSGDMVMASYFSGNGGCVDGAYWTNYNNLKEGESTEMNSPDGLTYTRIGQGLKKYTIHWYNQNSGKRNCIVARVHGDWATDNLTELINIYGAELRKGYWTEEQANSNSLIRQTANEIELKVKNTGINIEDGSITLNADTTTITGNLNLTNANQGLIIYDEYGNPKITVQNETLGNLEDFDFGADKQLTVNTTSTVNSASYTVTLPTVNLGTFTAGQKLQLHDLYVSSFNKENPFKKELVTLNYTYTIYCGTTQITSKNGRAQKKDIYYELADLNQDVTTSGDYTMTLTITGRITDTSLYGQWFHRLTLYVRSIQTNINKIASDGAVFASSTNQFNWFGSDQTLLRNGNAAIRLKDGRLQRNVLNNSNNTYSTTFADASTQLPYDFVNSLTKIATLNDGVIIFSSVIGTPDTEQRTLYLPRPSECPGKIYYVKNIVGSNTKVYVNSASTTEPYFMASNSNSQYNNITINANSAIFISGVWTWIHFSCA